MEGGWLGWPGRFSGGERGMVVKGEGGGSNEDVGERRRGGAGESGWGEGMGVDSSALGWRGGAIVGDVALMEMSEKWRPRASHCS